MKYALIFIACSLVNVSAMAAPSLYSLTEIGDLAGGVDLSEAWDVNDLGQVVGSSEASTGVRGFLWDDGTMTNLGDLPGGNDGSHARGINNSTQITGFSLVETTPNDQFQKSRFRPFLWEGGVMTNLGRLPTGQFHAEGWGINEFGQVGGWSHASPGHNEAVRIDTSPIIIMVPMNTHMAEDQSRGYGLNEAGQIPGYSNGNTTPEPVMWDSDNSIVPLGDLPGGTNNGEARGINDNAQVVGWSDASTGRRAFIWDNGSMTNLGDLPGGDDLSQAWAINNQGSVVGFSGVPGGNHAFVWSAAQGMQDLNTLVDSSGDGWTLTEARGLNETGQIAGVGINPSGAIRGFLLTTILPLAQKTQFAVSKRFTDSNTGEVQVTLSCNTGLPLKQSFMISENKPVVFVVSKFTDGKMDCTITETAVVDGYTPSYSAGGDSQNDNGTQQSSACRFFDIGFEDENTCTVTNTLEKVFWNITKVWEFDENQDEFDQHAYIEIFIENFRTNPSGSLESISDRLPIDGNWSNSFFVHPNFGTPATRVRAVEHLLASGVDSDQGCAEWISIEVGDEPVSCTITNTIFFEGIPTMSQYGLAVLALLMLGAGFVGFRRFT